MKFALGNLKINDAIKTAALSALFAANLHTTLPAHAFGEAFLDRVQSNINSADGGARLDRFSQQTRSTLDAAKDAVDDLQDVAKDPSALKVAIDTESIKGAVKGVAADVAAKAGDALDDVADEGSRRIAKNTGELATKLDAAQDVLEDQADGLKKAAPVVAQRAKAGADRSLEFTKERVSTGAKKVQEIKSNVEALPDVSSKELPALAKGVVESTKATASKVAEGAAPLAATAKAAAEKAGSAATTAASAAPGVLSKAGEISSSVAKTVADTATKEAQKDLEAAKGLAPVLADAPTQAKRYGKSFKTKSFSALSKRAAEQKAAAEVEIADSKAKIAAMETKVATSVPTKEALDAVGATAGTATKQVAESLKGAEKAAETAVASAAQKEADTIKSNVAKASPAANARYSKFQSDTAKMVDAVGSTEQAIVAAAPEVAAKAQQAVGQAADAAKAAGDVVKDVSDPESLKRAASNAGKAAKKTAKAGAMNALKAGMDAVQSIVDDD